MTTRFKLIFEGGEPDINLPRFRKSLPVEFEVASESDGIYIDVPSNNPEDERCQYLVDRELDRHFFLTSVKIMAEMVRTRITISLTVRNRIHGELPEDIGPQCWNYELPIQLRLWAIATDTQDLVLKALLLFQIIELSYPEKSSYPEYTDASNEPNPLTECKFIRHLVVHSGEVRGNQLGKYCEYLDIPEMTFDPTDPTHSSILAQKSQLLECQAKDVISNSL